MKLVKQKTKNRSYSRNVINMSNILNVEAQEGDIWTVDIVLLLDFEVAHKTSIMGFRHGDKTVAIANLGWGGWTCSICNAYKQCCSYKK